MDGATVTTVHPGDILDHAAFSLDELARACGMPPGWVLDRLHAEIITASASASGAEGAQWRFDSVTLVRARRIAQLESTFGADPQLAALTTDLIEEVARLRRRLHAARPGRAPPANDGKAQ